MEWGHYLIYAKEFKKCDNEREKFQNLNELVEKYGANKDVSIVTGETSVGETVVAVFEKHIVNKIKKKETSSSVDYLGENIKEIEDVSISDEDKDDLFKEIDAIKEYRVSIENVEIYDDEDDWKEFYNKRNAVKDKKDTALKRIINRIKYIFTKRHKKGVNSFLLEDSSRKKTINDKVNEVLDKEINFQEANVVTIDNQKETKEKIEKSINNVVDTSIMSEWKIANETIAKDTSDVLYQGPTEDEIKEDEKKKEKEFTPNLEEVYGKIF